MITYEYVIIWSMYNMYLLFYVKIGVLVVEIIASNELSWSKRKNFILQQRDGRHECEWARMLLG